MFRKVLVASAAVAMAGVGTIAAQAAMTNSDELVFASSMLKFDKGYVDFCNYGDDSMSATFLSDKGHNLNLMYEAKKGTISITGVSKNSAVITDGRVDDKGSFLFKGIISDTVGKSADFVFSGVCVKNGTNKPNPTPKPVPSELFSMTTNSGKYNFSGNKVNRCVFGKGVLFGEFVGSKGDVFDVKISADSDSGNGPVNLKTAKGEKITGVANRANVNDNGDFTLSGTFKVGMGEDFIFTGTCAKR